MTNVSRDPEKVLLRKRLVQIGLDALRAQGWAVAKMPGSGKSSLRRITRGDESQVVSIRTTRIHVPLFRERPRAPRGFRRTASSINKVLK